MAGRSMEVNAANLNVGADRCGEAAATALRAADKLTEKAPMAGMFGDFAEAHEFHQAISSAHQDHVDQLRGHHQALTNISDKGLAAAREFTARDASTADSLRAAGAGFDAL